MSRERPSPGSNICIDLVSGTVSKQKNHIAEDQIFPEDTAETLRTTAGQARNICELYSPQEIRSMLRRLKKTALGELSQEQTKKIILKRSETFRERV